MLCLRVLPAKEIEPHLQGAFARGLSLTCEPKGEIDESIYWFVKPLGWVMMTAQIAFIYY